MIEVDYSNFLDIDALSIKKDLSLFCDNIKARKVGFYNLMEEAEIKKIQDFVIKKRKKLETIVVIGMGGSSVGFKAIWGAMRNQMDKTVHFIDDINPSFVKEKIEQIDCSRTLFLFISKSGKTVETISLFSYFQTKVSSENLVFISEKGSFLDKVSQKLKIPFFIHPQNVGGRFAVLSVVGMLPAAFCGFDIEEFLTGGQLIYKDFLNNDLEKNRCFQLAMNFWVAHKKGYSNVVFWSYFKELENVGQWFNQLISESIGKNADGITPVLATGVGAQHSLLQNFIDGKNDKFFIFLDVKNLDCDEKILEKSEFEEFLFLKNKFFGDLLKAEFLATRDALIEKGKPVLSFEIDKISSQDLGEFFALFMGTTVFLGELLKIDAFDQPGVERSKVLAKEYLKK